MAQAHSCPGWQGSLGVQVDVLDGQVPVRIEDFKAALLFLLVRLLVGIELFDERFLVEAIIGDGGILKDDGDAVVPSTILGRVVARSNRRHF